MKQCGKDRLRGDSNFNPRLHLVESPAQARTTAQADWDAINGILVRDPGNLMVCGEVTPLGSHLRKIVCRTLAQLGYRKGQSPRLQLAIMELHTNTL